MIMEHFYQVKYYKEFQRQMELLFLKWLCFVFMSYLIKV